MHKIGLSLLFFISGATDAMNRFPQDISTIQRMLRDIECIIAFPPDQENNPHAQAQSLKTSYLNVTTLIQKHGLTVPDKPDFDWLYKLKDSLNQGQPSYNSRKQSLKALYEEGQLIIESMPCIE